MARAERHPVAALCLDRVVAFDLGTAAEAFDLAWLGGRPAYEFTACAAEAGSVATTTGFEVAGLAGLEAVERARTVVLPGFLDVFDPPPEAALDALRAAAARGARMVSICTGAFALAAAGVLDGRRATTHWRDVAELAARHPAIRVEPDVLYLDEGEVLTSAGVAAGLDLCLHILRRDHGAALANTIARRIVVPPHREGGQAQYIEQPIADRPGGSLAATRAWALERLHEPLTVRALAAHAHVSERTFARRFSAETGLPFLRWLLAQRVDAARTALESTDASIDDIAHRCGFGTAANLRKHFHRHLATTPTAYRRAFAPT
ncbi:MAG: helix-turn-helix domain-containing protein [Solirubrobacterales bacterium]